VEEEKPAKPDAGDLGPEKAAPHEEEQKTSQLLIPQPPAKASSPFHERPTEKSQVEEEEQEQSQVEEEKPAKSDADELDPEKP
jgi:hypothetical protein